MEGIEYLYELCEALPRSGPGDNVNTNRAFNSISKSQKHPFILDIGCGQGMQTIELAKISNGKIIALDNHQAFLDILMKQAKNEGFEGKIEIIKKEGFNLISNFTLPESAWLNSYYIPIEKELPRLNKKYQGNEVALAIFEGFRNELDFYRKYSKFYGYEFFVMQK